MSTETVNITLSAKARETSFVICRNKKYTPDILLAAASLLKKLRDGTTPETMMVPDPAGVGTPLEITKYNGFKDNMELQITLEEKEILSSALKAVDSWHTDEADVVVELQEKLQVKLT